MYVYTCGRNIACDVARIHYRRAGRGGGAPPLGGPGHRHDHNRSKRRTPYRRLDVVVVFLSFVELTDPVYMASKIILYYIIYNIYIYNIAGRLDVVVVFLSFVELTDPSMQPWLVQLMRACRVIRLFGRFESLKKMVGMSCCAVLYCIVCIRSYHITNE